MYRAGWLCGWINCDKLWHQQGLDAAWLCGFVTYPPLITEITYLLYRVSELCVVWDPAWTKVFTIVPLCKSCAVIAKQGDFQSLLTQMIQLKSKCREVLMLINKPESDKMCQFFSVGAVVFGLVTLKKSLNEVFGLQSMCEKNRLCFACGLPGRKDQCSWTCKRSSDHAYFGIWGFHGRETI